MSLKEESSGHICGVNPLLEALRAAARSFDKVYIARDKKGKEIQEILDRCRALRVPFSFEDRGTLDRLAPGVKHQGVIGVASVKTYSTVDDVLRAAEARREDPLIVILTGVEDPRNLGAIIRTAEAAGVHGIILPQRRSVGLTETVAKTSAGALEHLPVVRVVNIGQTVGDLQERGIWVMALDPSGETPYDRMDYQRPLALLVGGEGSGVGPALLKRADARLRIPLYGRVASLNVSVASGIALFEVLRSRRGAKTDP
jgi:23S rRNA (guanosine2251-2'-O)-methyltransferase